MFCLIQFYVQLRTPLAEHSPFLKVLAIKLVIFLSFWQSAAISVGTSTLDIVHPNKVLAYPDLKVGIPSLLLCFEMAVFAILHLWAFPYRPYLDSAKPTFYPVPNPDDNSQQPRENEHVPRAGGFIGIKALWDAMNLWDIVKAFGRGIRWLFVGVKHRHQDPSYHPALRKNSAGESAVSMSDLGPSGKKSGRDGIDTAYRGGGPGARSTDHLPIASEFRRSRYGMTENYGGSDDRTTTSGGQGHHLGPYDRVGKDEHAGLIAHAQPEPHSPSAMAIAAGRREDEYDYDDDDRVRQHEYVPYGTAAPLSTVEEEPYGSRRNPRNSTQAQVGAALWGSRPPQGR